MLDYFEICAENAGMGLNIDAAASKLLGRTANFVVDSERKENFANGEYLIGRYINGEHDYFLVTSKALRVRSPHNERVIWYRDIKSVGIEGTFNSSSPPQMIIGWKKSLQNESNRLLKLELFEHSAEFLLLVSGEQEPGFLDLFQVRKFLSKVTFFESKRASREAG